MTSWFLRDVWTALGGAILALVLAGIVIRWVSRLGFMDLPGGRRTHDAPIPRVGGMVLLGILLFGKCSGLISLPLHPVEWLGLLVMGSMGIVDDRVSLSPKLKASVGLLVAVVLGFIGAQEMAHQTNAVHWLGFPMASRGPVVVAMLTMLYWLMPNAFNLIDGVNGLCMGFSLMVLGVLAFVGVGSVFLLGGMAAILVLNWPKARLFLGDAGSLTLGLLAALLVVKRFLPFDPDQVFWMLMYPVADVCLVVLIRSLKGQSLGTGDRSHMHHQLVDRFGWPARLVGPWVWAQCALLMGGNWLPEALAWFRWVALAVLAIQWGVFLVASVFQGRGWLSWLQMEAADLSKTYGSHQGDHNSL